jgi:hypothetical protein
MTDLVTVETGAHVAVLDVMTGQGLLVLPRPPDDVADPEPAAAVTLASPGGVLLAREAPGTLHSADLSVMLGKLARLGWDVLCEDDGAPLEDLPTDSGRTTWGLYGLHPVYGDPPLDRMAEASAALLDAARSL